MEAQRVEPAFVRLGTRFSDVCRIVLTLGVETLASVTLRTMSAALWKR